MAWVLAKPAGERSPRRRHRSLRVRSGPTQLAHAAGIALALSLTLTPPLAAQTELRYEVRHDHALTAGTGMLTIGEGGVSFREGTTDKPGKHAFDLPYQDVQELKLSPTRLVLVTYKDRKWRWGADQQYEFTLASGKTFQEAYQLLEDRLDQRFVAALPDEQVEPLWELPVKLLDGISGSEGVLRVGADRMVYKTDREEHSRTWRDLDVENVSTSGPFQLTLTTFERARWDYASLKGFNFQLKRPLDQDRYNQLWRRLNQSKGVPLLTSVTKGAIKP